VRYVHTKAIKRLELLRVRNAAPDQQRKFLLPISFGVSSVALLGILDHHLKRQKTNTGRTGFSLIIFFVDCSSVEKSPANNDLLARVKDLLPDHDYVSASLPEVFHLIPTDDPLHGLLPSVKVEEDVGSSEPLTVLMNALTSATARADVVPILRTRLVVEQAKSLGCEGILWGHSTTKLAELTLAETAKGRGYFLPWQTADGESPSGMPFYYPLRDLLKKELIAYVDISDPSLSPLVHEPSTGATQASMSSKNTTIDDLMKQYFESVEENFPSIVANVVRTTGKLEATSSSSSSPRCSLCHMPVTDGRFGIHGWGGDQQDGLIGSAGDHLLGLCYGCTRSVPGLVTNMSSNT
jgi:cytoplasmic tRNA 2-thiolation protein 2